MSRRLSISLWVNAAWMAFVWSTRIRNAVGDRTYHGGVLVATVAMSGAFIAAGLVLAGLAVIARRRPMPTVGPLVIRVVAVVGSLVWVVRGVQIAGDGRGAAFIAVHEVLAAISIGLAVWMWIELGRSGGDRYDADRYGTARDGHREALQAGRPGPL